LRGPVGHSVKPQATAVCLVGPTAAGKTDVAVELVRRFPFEIISVDSAMVYRHMDIGTAKPGPEILADAPHRLIDIRDPWDSYSAGQFCADALKMIVEIRSAGRVPLLVGGTSLYFRSLQHGIAQLPAADPDTRRELDQRAELAGWPALHAELSRVDPVAAGRIEPNDRQRIQRALEVFALTGQPISVLQGATGEVPDIDFLRLAMLPGDRPALHRRIEARFSSMMEAGFLEEVERLRAMPGLSAESAAMRAVGYRQLWAFMDGTGSLDEAVEKGVVATRQLAKRQLTWMRSERDEHEFDCLEPDVAAQIIKAVEVRIDEIT
jgi:tRNA dimethylallyltransferase